MKRDRERGVFVFLMLEQQLSVRGLNAMIESDLFGW